MYLSCSQLSLHIYHLSSLPPFQFLSIIYPSLLRYCSFSLSLFCVLLSVTALSLLCSLLCSIHSVLCLPFFIFFRTIIHSLTLLHLFHSFIIPHSYHFIFIR
uniref:Uncharacterized protein n=1 Tax=Cacopsylla melanoneura TaxID=428564 RepID=A0A8D8XBV2_9HEMI